VVLFGYADGQAFLIQREIIQLDFFGQADAFEIWAAIQLSGGENRQDEQMDPAAFEQTVPVEQFFELKPEFREIEFIGKMPAHRSEALFQYPEPGLQKGNPVA
jgi:hypothetical protein